jgi:hypothetical protein
VVRGRGRRRVVGRDRPASTHGTATASCYAERRAQQQDTQGFVMPRPANDLMRCFSAGTRQGMPSQRLRLTCLPAPHFSLLGSSQEHTLRYPGTSAPPALGSQVTGPSHSLPAAASKQLCISCIFAPIHLACCDVFSLSSIERVNTNAQRLEIRIPTRPPTTNAVSIALSPSKHDRPNRGRSVVSF